MGAGARWVLGIFAIVGLAVMAVWPWVPATRFLYDLSAGPSPIAARQISYTVSGPTRLGDFYPTGNGSGRTGLVLVPGASPSGKNDPALIRFAQALTHAGFDVLVPDIANARLLRVGPNDADDVADAAAWMAERKSRVGVTAISYGVGPAILAALRPDSRVDFILAIGGYYDVEAVAGFFTTGWYFEDGLWRERQPNAYGRWAFARANAMRLVDSGDRAMLDAWAERRMSDPSTDTDDLLAHMTPSGRSVVELMENRDRRLVRPLIEALPTVVRADLRAMDLSRRDLSGLRARLILVHGRDDTIIPAGESVKLAATVPHARLFVADDLAHTRWSPRHMASVLTLLAAARELLAESR